MGKLYRVFRLSFIWDVFYSSISFNIPITVTYIGLIYFTLIIHTLTPQLLSQSTLYLWVIYRHVLVGRNSLFSLLLGNEHCYYC